MSMLSTGEVVVIDKVYKRVKPRVFCGLGRTKQQFKDRVNVNSILARFHKSGMIDHLNAKTPFYGDVSNVLSYPQALDTVRIAEDLFSKMSAEVRSRFGNDPMEMIKFLSDKANIDEAIKLGMAVRKVEDPPIRVDVVGKPGEPAKPAEATKP